MGLPLKLGFIACLNLVAGLGFNVLILAVVGPASEADAYFASLILPQFMSSVLGTLVNTSLVPMLAGEKHPSAYGCANLLKWLLGLHMFLALILAALAPLWVPLLVPGFHDHRLRTAVLLSRIQLASLVFTPLSATLSSVLQAQKRFLSVEVSSILPGWAALILLMPAFRAAGIEGAAYVAVGRSAFTAGVLCLLVPRCVWRSSRPELPRQFWKISYPILLGNVYYKTAPIANGLLASLAPPGGLSVLHITERLCAAVNEVLRRSVAVPALPVLAEACKAGDRARFAHVYHTRLVALSLISLAFYLGLLAILPVAGSLLKASTGSPSDSTLLAKTFASLGGYIVGGAAGLVLAGAWYARGASRTAALVGICSFTVGLVLRIIFGISMGIPGIGLSISLHYLLACATYLALEIRFSRRLGAGGSPRFR
jgi:putative peptidoglycan lipid II flippase